jgi:2-methylfumaryl-CoA isomerase
VNSLLPAWDALTGLHAALAILAAERHRRATGEGQLVTLALSDVALALTGHLGRIAQAQLGGDAPRDGNYLYGAFGRDFTTGDGRRVMVTGLTARQWRALVAATGTGEDMAKLAAATGHDLATEAGRFAARDQIASVLEPWFAARDLAAAAAELSAAGACWGPYQTFRQLVTEDPRCSAANPLFTLAEHPGVGSYLMPGTPLRFGAGPQPPAGRAPLPGEHTREVLTGLLGLAADDIDGLARDGVVVYGPGNGSPRRR